MRKLLYLLLGLIIITTISCEKDEDAIYISHKLMLNAEKTTEYYTDIINFSWNEITMVNQVGYLLVRFYDEQDVSLYEEIVDYYINGGSYYDYPDWMDYCSVYAISKSVYSHTRYDYSYEDDKNYFALLAFDSNGNYIVSNTVYI